MAAEEAEIPKKKCAPRTVGVLRPYTFDADGNIKFLQPTETFWYCFYVQGGSNAPVNGSYKYKNKFCRRFRMPHEEFLKLLGEVHQNYDLFGRWQRPDTADKACAPLSLLLLGALKYLGRGLTFDDMEEHTAISEENHRQFFHKFIAYGELVLFPKHVRMPTTAEEYRFHQPEYSIGGLNGCGFSADATNVILWRCSHNLKQAHMGFKQNHPSRTCNTTTNHHRYIMHTTKGHCSRWNDKSLAYVDEFMTGVHEGKILQDVSFTLYYKDPNTGLIGEQAHRGAWGLVDNGYHKWPSTQAPAKASFVIEEARLSEWIESFRKDSECVFGILKGRWRILKTGIRLQGAQAADRIWLTCCALHNRLLEVDGLSAPWTGELGENDVDGFRRQAPFAIRSLTDQEIRTFGSRDHEQASAEPRFLVFDAPSPNDNDEENVQEESVLPGSIRYDDNGAIFVNSLSYDAFRSRLVEHFDLKRHKKEVKWPTRE